MRSRLGPVFLSICLLLGLQPAHYQGPPTGGPGAGSATVITKAVADLTNPAMPQITIHGEDFGTAPQVLLGEDMGTLVPLFVQLATDTLV